MTTALLLAALAVTSFGWFLASSNWHAAEEEVLRLCAALREAEGRAWEAGLVANLGHIETPAQDSDA